MMGKKSVSPEKQTIDTKKYMRLMHRLKRLSWHIKTLILK